jgi:hypothetical protein
MLRKVEELFRRRVFDGFEVDIGGGKARRGGRDGEDGGGEEEGGEEAHGEVFGR